MIDVFISTCATDPIRRRLFQATIERWKCDPLANMKFILTKETVVLNPLMFSKLKSQTEFILDKSVMQRERRILADREAKSDIYIVTDDDCIPLGLDFIERGVRVMEAHPQHGVLAALNIRSDTLFKNGIAPYCGEFIDDDVWDCHAVGGIRFCRKGAIKEWPASVSEGSYDMQHHEGLVNAGFRAGYMRNVLFNHLGEGLSTHWPGIPEIDQLMEAKRGKKEAAGRCSAG